MVVPETLISSIAVSSSTVFGRETQAQFKLGNGCGQRPRQQNLIIYTWFLREKIWNTWRKQSGTFRKVRGQMEETILANVRTSGTLQTLICPNSRISGSAWLGTGPGLLVPETLTPWNCPPYQGWVDWSSGGQQLASIPINGQFSRMFGSAAVPWKRDPGDTSLRCFIPSSYTNWTKDWLFYEHARRDVVFSDDFGVIFHVLYAVDWREWRMSFRPSEIQNH